MRLRFRAKSADKTKRRRSLPIPLVFALMVGAAAGLPTGIGLVYAIDKASTDIEYALLAAVLVSGDLLVLGLAAFVAGSLVKRSYLPSRRFAAAVLAMVERRFADEKPVMVERDLQPALDLVWALGRGLTDPERRIIELTGEWQRQESELSALARHWQRQHAQARGLIDLIGEINQATGLQAVLERLAAGLSRFFASDAVAIWIHDPDEGLGLAVQVAGEFPLTLKASAPWVQNVLAGTVSAMPKRDPADTRPSTALPLQDAQGRTVGIVALSSDKRTGYRPDDQAFLRTVIGYAALAITNAMLYDHTDELSRTDALTGLQNRREFDRVLRLESERGRRYQIPLSLLMIDIDHFKRVNDERGHPAGDWALQQIGEVIQQTPIRQGDATFRIGGEEFAILLTQTNKAGAMAVAERLRQVTAETPIFSDGGSVTISVGVASLPDDAADAGELTACADRALYDAKHAGRNRVCGAPQTRPPRSGTADAAVLSDRTGNENQERLSFTRPTSPSE